MPLARGGFGSVVLGASRQGRKVAIKIVRSDASQRVTDIAARHLEVVQKLELTGSWMNNVLIPLDWGINPQGFFTVMPLATQSLADALGGGSVDDFGRFGALRAVINGLVELASAGIVHGDLKPANVLNVDGTWKVADFGLSRYLYRPPGHQPGMVAGTPSFMAPEVWNSMPASSKSDLYSLGVLMFELLAGRSPLLESDVAGLRWQYEEGFAPLSLVDERVRPLIAQLLNKDPSQRPQDALAVAEFLDRITN